jgi:hypothetical protein
MHDRWDFEDEPKAPQHRDCRAGNCAACDLDALQTEYELDEEIVYPARERA